jgi:hypothetical protein
MAEPHADGDSDGEGEEEEEDEEYLPRRHAAPDARVRTASESAVEADSDAAAVPTSSEAALPAPWLQRRSTDAGTVAAHRHVHRSDLCVSALSVWVAADWTLALAVRAPYGLCLLRRVDLPDAVRSDPTTAAQVRAHATTHRWIRTRHRQST